MNESRERIRKEREREKNTYTSPRLALRRVLLLSEGRQFREAAAILSRLGPAILQSVAADLPIDLLVESLPHSAHLLETLLCRLSTTELNPKPDIQPELIAWRLVGLFGSARDPTLRQRCGKLARELAVWRPQVRDAIALRRRELDSAVQGLGSHGLTADGSGALISLHVAIKNELQRHIETYKAAVHKLEELSNVTINQDPASSSHQRLLALSHSDVERRLIDNKSLLTIVDKPALRQLPALITSLEARVKCDKDVLSCIGQIKRIDPTLDITDARPAAGILMSYSRGCDAALALMPPASSPAPGSPGGHSCCSDGYHSDSDAQHDIDNTKSVLVSRYGQLFAHAQKDTMEALGALEPLQHAHQLKSKIIFSVIVETMTWDFFLQLSFRACQGMQERRMSEARGWLGAAEEATSPALARLRAAAGDVLRETVDSFPLGEAERLVANQVLQTLHEYPCLESCVSLFRYIACACRVAWTLVNQNPPMLIDMDFTPVLMRPDKHVRFVTSDQRTDLIRSFVWPALMDGQKCVYKAIIMT